MHSRCILCRCCTKLYHGNAFPVQVRAMMKLDYTPSALQVRYAGAKGVLCVYPDMPENKRCTARVIITMKA